MCNISHADEGSSLPPLITYENTKQGYRLIVPSSFERIDKAGADVLFEDPSKRSTSIGVTCNPVRIKSLEAFGSLGEIGARLIETEVKKESTHSINLLSKNIRASATSGALLYEYDYVIDSTRGKKRVLNVVSIFDYKLYIFNGSIKCEKSPQSPQIEGEELKGGPEAAAPGGGCLGPIEVLRSSSASFEVTR